MWCLETIKELNQKAARMPITQAMAECGIRCGSQATALDYNLARPIVKVEDLKETENTK